MFENDRGFVKFRACPFRLSFGFLLLFSSAKKGELILAQPSSAVGSGDRAKRCLSEHPALQLLQPGRRCVETSDDVIEDDFIRTPDSRLWDFSPMRLGAVGCAFEPRQAQN